MITVGRDLIYTDIWSFWDRLDTFLDKEATRGQMESQLSDLFSTLLQGSAVYRWTNELPADVRRRLRADGLNALMAALEIRFAMDPGRATKKSRKTEFRLRDLLDHEYGLRKFIQGRSGTPAPCARWIGTTRTGVECLRTFGRAWSLESNNISRLLAAVRPLRNTCRPWGNQKPCCRLPLTANIRSTDRSLVMTELGVTTPVITTSVARMTAVPMSFEIAIRAKDSATATVAMTGMITRTPAEMIATDVVMIGVLVNAMTTDDIQTTQTSTATVVVTVAVIETVFATEIAVDTKNSANRAL